MNPLTLMTPPPNITTATPSKASSIQKSPPKEAQTSQNDVKGKSIPKWTSTSTGSQTLAYFLILNIGAGLFSALYLYLAAGVVASTAANKIGKDS